MSWWVNMLGWQAAFLCAFAVVYGTDSERGVTRYIGPYLSYKYFYLVEHVLQSVPSDRLDSLCCLGCLELRTCSTMDSTESLGLLHSPGSYSLVQKVQGVH